MLYDNFAFPLLLQFIYFFTYNLSDVWHLSNQRHVYTVFDLLSVKCPN